MATISQRLHQNVFLVLLGERVAKKKVQIPLFSDTVSYCIQNLTSNVANQLTEKK